MSKEDVYLSVVVPAYNEERRIEKTLRRIAEYLAQKPFTHEIVVVIDGATDGTADVVRRLEKDIPHMRFIDRKVNRGKGASVIEGMLASAGKIRLFTDADNSTDIAYFEHMRPLFDKGYEVVISSRNAWDAAGASQEISQVWYKRLMGIAGNIFIQLVAVRGIWDTQNGFKAFRDFAVEAIFPQLRIQGWGFDIEILALARGLKYRIGIIPVHWKNDTMSHVRLLSYIEVLWQTVLVRWNVIRGRYKL